MDAEEACGEAFSGVEAEACQETVADGDAFFSRTGRFYGEVKGSIDGDKIDFDDPWSSVNMESSRVLHEVDFEMSDLDGPHDGEGIYVLPNGQWGYIE